MIVVDTTVLVYAVGADHPLRAPCRALMALARDRSVEATTTAEVVQEFAHVWGRRRPRADAAGLAGSYTAALGPLQPVNEPDLAWGLRLFVTNPALGAFDAVLAAVALRRDAALASADRSFAGVAGLAWLDPGAPSFLADAQGGG